MIRHILFLLATLPMAVFSATLTSMVSKEQSGHLLVNFAVRGSVQEKVFNLSAPNRVVIDLSPAITRLDERDISRIKPNWIVQARFGTPRTNTLRIVLDVNASIVVKSSRWYGRGTAQQILQVELEKQPARTKQQLVTQVMPHVAPIVAKHNVVSGTRTVIVVLDPGHGGHDPGAIGAKHTSEKNVVLALAIKLKRLIDKQPGMRAVLTRSGDYFVGLRERLNIARKQNADIFVSIHADAFIHQHSHGVSVFALSATGATSEAARWLAEKENYSELGGVNLSDLDDRNGLIRTVLIDLSQTATIASSLQIGSTVLQHLGRVTDLHNHKVEQARFMVLKSPDIPSVLIETGFITNPHEEDNLTNTLYQTKLTQAIFTGIYNYFLNYPPQGSRLEAIAEHVQPIALTHR